MLHEGAVRDPTEGGREFDTNGRSRSLGRKRLGGRWGGVGWEGMGRKQGDKKQRVRNK